MCWCVCRGRGSAGLMARPSGWGAGDPRRLTGCSHSLFSWSHLWHTGLYGRWQLQSNSHPASQWLWPPNNSITSSSSGLPQPVWVGFVQIKRWQEDRFGDGLDCCPQTSGQSQTTVFRCSIFFCAQSESGWECGQTALPRWAISMMSVVRLGAPF